MVDYVALAAVAQTLIETNGRLITLRKANRTADNTSEPWRGTSTAPVAGQEGDTQTAIGVFVPPRGTGLGRMVQDMTGQLLSAFDQVCLIASDSVPGVDLEPFGTIVDTDSVVWQIKLREQLKPGDVSLIWVLGLKR